MGVEFLQKTAKTIKVARDRALAALAAGDLLTRRMALPRTCELLRLFPGCTVKTGDRLHLELKQATVVAVKGEGPIGEIEGPMPGTVELLQKHGAVGGRIDEVNESACVADVEITG
jgi:hypothetical protein